jgi:hypothetical protein
MSRPVLYIAATNHGFGHAARTATVAAQIQRLNPDISIVMVTTAPRWLLDAYIPGDFIYRPRAFDVGVVQSDGITMDLEATLEKLQDVRSKQNRLIATEVDFIRTNKVGLILADIPPLAAPIAVSAGIPCWMMSNFGWDFIYRPWGGEFLEMADWIGDCFRQCDRLFRFPLNEPMPAFSKIIDVGLTGGTPSFDLDRLRSEFGITAPPEKTALLSFGGLGLSQLPYDNIRQFPDWQFIVLNPKAPQDIPNLVVVSDLDTYKPVDFMPLCGRLITKPGYGTFADALSLNLPIVSLTREGFAESEVLLDWLQDYGYHQIISPEEFSTGSWEFLRQPLLPPRSDRKLSNDGAQTIARAVCEFLAG